MVTRKPSISVAALSVRDYSALIGLEFSWFSALLWRNVTVRFPTENYAHNTAYGETTFLTTPAIKVDY